MFEIGFICESVVWRGRGIFTVLPVLILNGLGDVAEWNSFDSSLSLRLYTVNIPYAPPSVENFSCQALVLCVVRC